MNDQTNDAGTTKDNGREKILTAAFELFAEKGYAQTSVDSIAVKAKISKGLIYHYFNSKEIILKSVFDRIKQEGDILYEGMEQLSPDQFLDKMINQSINFVIYQKKIFRLMMALTIQPDVIEGMKEMIDTWKNEWLVPLENIFTLLNYENPKAEAYFLAALLDGVGLGYTVMEPGYPIEEVQELIRKRYKLPKR